MNYYKICLGLFCSVFLLYSAFSQTTNIVAGKEAPIPTSELRQKADSVLEIKDNVNARREIHNVLALVDRLMEEGKPADARKYLDFALQTYPWALSYQLISAQMLKDDGRADESKAKAELVYKYAETDDLLDRASVLLGKPSLPALSPMVTLAGTNYEVVLVPVGECDRHLLYRMQKEIGAILNIPVHVQSVAMIVPPYARDAKSRMLAALQADMLADANTKDMMQTLGKLNLKPSDLRSMETCLKVLKHLIVQQGGEAEWAKFQKAMEQNAGRMKQWNADVLRETLINAVKPFRRANVLFLGVTRHDIFADDSNFLFGLADKQGGIISYARFSSDFNDQPPNPERLATRTVKQALSSLGFVTGVKRCSDPTCPRAYPHSLAEHDAKGTVLCGACEKAFKGILGK